MKELKYSFTKSDDTTILKTYRINDRYTNKGGKKIFPSPAVAPST